MSTDLPAPVAGYLEAKNGAGEAVLENFADDAIVHDEGRTHVGIAAIRDWAAQISAAYQLERTVTEMHRAGPATVVLVHVTGDFPGSPVDLHHHFSVARDRISALTICP
jgi:hypothetical protein